MHINMNAFEQVDTPALVVNMAVAEANVAAMIRFASDRGLKLRPHLKTIRSSTLANALFGATESGVTVAKLEHAEIVSQYFGDIFIANSVVSEYKLNRLASLSRSVSWLGCGLDNLEAARMAGQIFSLAGLMLKVLVKIDVGLGRLGILPEQSVGFVRLVRQIPGLEFCGIYTHAGHAYRAKPEDVAEVGRQEGILMVNVKRALDQEGIACPIVSVGSTPTAKFSGRIDGVTEIRPGVFVLNDRTQIALGIASQNDCALFVLATVISKHGGLRAYIDAGSQVFSSDRGPHGTTSLEGFGEVVGHPDVVVSNLSEEHGWLAGPGVDNLEVGQKVLVIPNHACATINLTDTLLGVRDGKVVGSFCVDGRGAVH